MKQINAQLMWVNNDPSNTTGVLVERQTGAGSPWDGIADLSGDVASYMDNGLAQGISHQWRVCGYNDIGKSAYATSDSVTTPKAPAAPTLLTVTIQLV